MCEAVKARGKLNGQELIDVPVLTPGDWFGKCWLLEVGGSHSPLFLVVEADSVSAAIDELADDPKHGHHMAKICLLKAWSPPTTGGGRESGTNATGRDSVFP